MLGLLTAVMLTLPAFIWQEAPGVTGKMGTINTFSAAMACSAGVGSKVQTSGVRGPDGIVVGLAITSDDDHRKMSHECESAYSLLVTLPGKPVRSVDLGWDAIDVYGRRLEVRAEGFSSDGKRFFGLACESGSPTLGEAGKNPYRRPGAYSILIEYQVGSDRASTFYLSRFVPYTVGCGSEALRVVGATSSGEAVVALKDGESTRQWAIQPESNSARPLPKKTSFLPLIREQ